MGKLINKGKKFLKIFDMFSNTQMLRFQEEPEFKSVSGAIISLGLILMFTVVFTNTVINTFNYTNITSTVSQGEETEPSYFQTDDTPFLFAIGLTGLNLNDPSTKYFNILFSTKKTYANGTKVTTFINLVPCQRSEWSAIDPSFGAAYDRIGFKNWLCLPANMNLEFQGKFSSNTFKYVKISVQNCSASPGDNRTCASPTVIDNLIKNSGSITLSYYFVNTILNPQDQQYISYYLQDRNYFTFTRTLGMSANLFISAFSIETDQSLWPVNNIKEDVGGLVYEPTQTFVVQPTTQYIQLFIRKSSLSLSITRSFQKVDDTLSYIGGLFSTIIAMLFFMSKFSQFGFEIKIASYLYKFDSYSKIKDGYYNLITFIPYFFYSILHSIGIPPKWKLMQQYQHTREEVGKQIDFTFLIRRIQFLEESLTYLFDDYELNCLHMKKKLTLQEAAQKRKTYETSKKLLKMAAKETKGKEKEQKIVRQEVSGIIINNQLLQISVLKSSSCANIKPEGNSATDDVMDIEEFEDQGYESSEIDEQQEQKILEKSVQSLEILEKHANQGNQRCLKIYNKLHKDFKNILESHRKSRPLVIESASAQDTRDDKRHEIVIDGYNHFEFQSIANIE